MTLLWGLLAVGAVLTLGIGLVVALRRRWLQTISYLLPTTYGTLVLRQLVVDDVALATTWANGSLPLLLVHSLVMFSLGWGCYKARE